MTNLPRALRGRLAAEAVVGVPELADRVGSRDGSEKLVLRLADGRTVHSVLMPDDDRLTLCVSTQVGCGFACAFCYTGTMGLVRNLTPGEIVGQVLAARAQLAPGARLTHIVFMGMGEPLANYEATVKALRVLTDPEGFGFSPRRITVSTVGLVQGIERLARENLRVNLAISLHAPTDEVRSRLMPVNRGWGLDELLAACRRFPLPVRQRITFEYVLLDGVNDSVRDARQLARRLAGLRAKVNLIPFNAWEGSAFRRPPVERIGAFQRVLLDAGITATVRWSKGEDVGAACGQLRTAERRREPETIPA
jgi:23S rRNA (adenine2503-C2)-methyltransferase